MKAAAFFDMDGAILDGETQFSFIGWRWGRRFASPLSPLCSAAESGGRLLGRLLALARIRPSGFAFLKDTPVGKMERWSAEYLETVQLLRMRRGAADLVNAHRERGHVTVLVTSVCEPLARPIAAWLGIDAVIATRLLASRGRYVCTREWPEPRGMGKRLLVGRFCAERDISAGDSHAYGTGHLDGPLLDFVGHPVAVNPTARLRRVAEARGWRIIDLDAHALGR